MLICMMRNIQFTGLQCLTFAFDWGEVPEGASVADLCGCKCQLHAVSAGQKEAPCRIQEPISWILF